ncbi:MAG: hypothetical protein HY898_17765 [Deltaproteobacteria bacterium]|nr:hypothetical protein [Deltaproteobacteria bacterium]
MRTRAWVSWIIASALWCGAVSCSGSEEAAPKKPFILEGDVYVVKDTNGITVEKDRLVLTADTHSEVLGLKAYTHIVGDRQTTHTGGNPNGFLRQVKSVSQQGDKIIVTTLDAYLTNIIKQGELRFVVQPDKGTTVKNSPWSPGYQPQDVYNGPEIGFPEIKLGDVKLGSYSGQWPVKIKGNTVQLNVSAEAKGELTGKLVFSPSVDIGFDITDFKLNEFHTVFIGDTEISLTGKLFGKVSVGLGSPNEDPLSPPDGSPLAVLMQGATDAQRNEYLKALKDAAKKSSFEIPLWSNTYQLPTVWIPVTPPIPIVTGLNVDLKLECPVQVSANITLEAGAKVTGQTKLGARYTNYNGDEKWDGVSERTLTSEPIGPNITGGAGIEFGCSIKPSLALIFYGLAGPTLWASAGTTVGLGIEQTCDGANSYPTTSLYGKVTSVVEAGVGAKFGLFLPGINIELAKKELSLFKWEKDIVSVSQALPGVKIGMCANGCADPPPCTLGQTECTDTNKVNVCEGNAGNCAEWKSHDCKTSTACYADMHLCVCGTECALGDVACINPGNVNVCEQDAAGCKAMVARPCKTADVCYTDPQKCADGGSTGTCTPGQKRCNTGNNGVETCNTSGTAWTQTESCSVTCSAGVCTTGLPDCGSGLNCQASPVTGATHCVQPGTQNEGWCCASGQTISNGACVGSPPSCATGLDCSASAVTGAAACMSGTQLVYCCPAGKMINNGACINTPPNCASGLECAANQISGSTACMSGTQLAYCCASGKVISNGACADPPPPACGSGLDCSASAVTGGTACMSGTQLVYCCAAGKMINNGVCINTPPNCGTGLACAANQISGSTACMSGTQLAYCCASGKIIYNGACYTPPTCGTGLSCAANQITGAAPCMSGTQLVYCCPSGKVISGGVCQ